jgi:hypothetical protein
MPDTDPSNIDAFAAVVVNPVATALKFGDRSKAGELLLGSALVPICSEAALSLPLNRRVPTGTWKACLNDLSAVREAGC